VEALESRLTVSDLRLNHAIQHIAGASENAMEMAFLAGFSPGFGANFDLCFGRFSMEYRATGISNGLEHTFQHGTLVRSCEFLRLQSEEAPWPRKQRSENIPEAPATM